MNGFVIAAAMLGATVIILLTLALLAALRSRCQPWWDAYELRRLQCRHQIARAQRNRHHGG